MEMASEDATERARRISHRIFREFQDPGFIARSLLPACYARLTIVSVRPSMPNPFLTNILTYIRIAGMCMHAQAWYENTSHGRTYIIVETLHARHTITCEFLVPIHRSITHLYIFFLTCVCIHTRIRTHIILDHWDRHALEQLSQMSGDSSFKNAERYSVLENFVREACAPFVSHAGMPHPRECACACWYECMMLVCVRDVRMSSVCVCWYAYRYASSRLTTYAYTHVHKQGL